jgi:hypothetical protein
MTLALETYGVDELAIRTEIAAALAQKVGTVRQHIATGVESAGGDDKITRHHFFRDQLVGQRDTQRRTRTSLRQPRIWHGIYGRPVFSFVDSESGRSRRIRVDVLAASGVGTRSLTDDTVVMRAKKPPLALHTVASFVLRTVGNVNDGIWRDDDHYAWSVNQVHVQRLSHHNSRGRRIANLRSNGLPAMTAASVAARRGNEHGEVRHGKYSEFYLGRKEIHHSKDTLAPHRAVSGVIVRCGLSARAKMGSGRRAEL